MKCPLIAVLLMAVVLFGCIGGGNPTPTPTPAPTQTPVVTPTPAPATPEPTPEPTATPEPTPIPPQSASIAIRNFAFDPVELIVPVGSTVTWTNFDGGAHQVASDQGATLNSPRLASGDSWSYTFTQPGTYVYHCRIHSSMRGTITVTP